MSEERTSSTGSVINRIEVGTIMSLLYAASSGDLEEVKRLLEVDGIDPNICDYDKRTPLHLAASEGHKEVIQYLLSQGADIRSLDRWQNTALEDAMRQGHYDCVQILQSHGAISRKEELAAALCAAASSGNVEELQKLVRMGVDVNSGDYDQRTALHLASSEGHIQAVEFLLQHGANHASLDRWHHTPLQDAIRHGYDKVAKLLADRGAVVKQEDFSIEGAQDWEISVSEITFVEKIGQGAFAEVYKALWRGNDVAVKLLKAQGLNATALLEFRREVSMLAKMRHPNVVLFMAACTKPPDLCICNEFLAGGSVYDHLHGKNGKKFEYHRILDIATDVALGMNHLHKTHIVHRDLKSANLVLDEHGVTKIVDFGLSRIEEESGNMTGETGSYRWAAPEVLKNEKYSEKVDVYSYAICLWEMLTGELPYSQYTPIQAAIAVAEKGIRPEIPKSCPANFASLIRASWDVLPAKRPSFEEVISRLKILTTEHISREKDRNWLSRKFAKIGRPRERSPSSADRDSR